MVMLLLLDKELYTNVSKWVTCHITNRMELSTSLPIIKSVSQLHQQRPELGYIAQMLLNRSRLQWFTLTLMNHNLFIKPCILPFNTGKSSIKISSSISLVIEDTDIMNKINHHSLNLWCIKSSVKERTCINCMPKNLSVKVLSHKTKSMIFGLEKWKNSRKLTMSHWKKLLIWENGRHKTITE